MMHFDAIILKFASENHLVMVSDFMDAYMRHRSERIYIAY